MTLINTCDRHAFKERRQISVFRHWCSSQFAPLRPRIHIPERSPRPRSWSSYLAFSLIIAIEYSVNDASFVSPDGRRVGGEEEEEKDEDRGKDTKAAVVHEEEDEEVDEARRRRGGERGRTRTPTMRRRYATEYHYPDNGPAISSTACINLRVKGQDTRYLNK